ncbi:ribosomal protein L21 [Rhodobacteraceae bacterium KLH11]|nr:ribosomal protein L21 [Rhodobacteraceae bacterium KLH11]
MRLLAAAAALTLWALPLAASEYAERLMRAMHLSDFMETLSAEGIAQGQAMDESMLAGSGGAYFQAQVEDLYDPEVMHQQLSQAVARKMTQTQLEQAAIFFESDLGQTIVSLENSARRAIGDEAIEHMARAAYDQADRDEVFFRLVEEYVQVNDLIAKNVRGTLSADYSFYRGLASAPGGVFDEALVLEELLAQQENTKAETTEWMYSFLLLAYQPLNEAQMRENIAFSRTEAGRALNTALF